MNPQGRIDAPQPVPTYKKIDAQTALDHANAICVRLRAMRDSKTMVNFVALRSALKFDIDRLMIDAQTL
jgi:hypothetical protein